jgi:hypothetical protein
LDDASVERRESSPSVSSGVRAERSGETVVLENALLRVEIGADGTLHRVYDLVLGGRFLTDGATSCGLTWTSRASGTPGTWTRITSSKAKRSGPSRASR